MSEKRIELTNNDANLGDTLALTAAFKKNYGLVRVVDLPATRNIYQVFNGLADVEFTKEHQPDCPQAPGNLPKAQKLLNYLGMDDVNCIPYVKLTEDEIEWGKEELKKKGVTNGVAVNLSAREKASYRSLPNQVVFDFLNNHYPNKQKLQFGLSSLIREKHGECIQMLDYGIRELAALYHHIGHYVGCDTGDYHLMLAVGGYCDVIIPPSKFPTYYWPFHLYTPDLWKGEKIRVKYHAYNKSEG